MARVAALGISNFQEAVTEDIFYVDKTHFIKEWWENRDKVTLITRPRRFGKTLTLNMVETFFSVRYAGCSDLFEKFAVWQEECCRKLQGTYPVISLSLAGVKDSNYLEMTENIKSLMANLYVNHNYLEKSDKLDESEKAFIKEMKFGRGTMQQCVTALRTLSELMYKHHGRNCIILIDEYDTPMLEAFVAGFWEGAIGFVRRLFHATFKDNPYLERGLMTGITRITRESIFSDMNNIRVVTTTTDAYTDCFGFTEEEVFAGLEEFDLADQKENVKRWYDGFQFGSRKDIYNPWSILNFLKQKKYEPYWMNTSGNALVGKLIQEGSLDVKKEFETMLGGGTVCTAIDESITYAELKSDSKTIWSWLLTTGYVRIVECHGDEYEIALTNHEVQKAMYRLIERWFSDAYNDYTGFIKMLLKGDLEGMNIYMDRLARYTFSYFDVGSESTESEKTEQFYHGFTLGIIADLNCTHVVTSNRESGFGRYDVCIEPRDKSLDGIIIEFKVFDAKKEKSLEETAERALAQIEEKNYEADLKARGIGKVRKYAFAFHGKQVLIAE